MVMYLPIQNRTLKKCLYCIVINCNLFNILQRGKSSIKVVKSSVARESTNSVCEPRRCSLALEEEGAAGFPYKSSGGLSF